MQSRPPLVLVAVSGVSPEEGAVGKETVFALDLSTSSLHLLISFLMPLSILYETLGHLPIPLPQPRIHATQV